MHNNIKKLCHHSTWRKVTSNWNWLHELGLTSASSTDVQYPSTQWQLPKDKIVLVHLSCPLLVHLSCSNLSPRTLMPRISPHHVNTAKLVLLNLLLLHCHDLIIMPLCDHLKRHLYQQLTFNWAGTYHLVDTLASHKFIFRYTTNWCWRVLVEKRQGS